LCKNTAVKQRETFDPMIIQNETARNDPAVQQAIQSYLLHLKKEEEYRNKVRQGLIEHIPSTTWNISDHD
jgi:hypothetical protein